ncbi:hypothetical protein ABR39_06345 [Enterobacter genomosp. O]|nr:hypothetical protein ABR39_06345 [Enterobacter genomosp. O]
MAGIIYHIMVIYGSDIEEKIFYDILAHIPDKYHFTYEDDKVLVLEKEMKAVIENTSKYPD